MDWLIILETLMAASFCFVTACLKRAPKKVFARQVAPHNKPAQAY